MWGIFVIVLSLSLASSEDSGIESKLNAAQKRINKEEPPYCYTSHTNTMKKYSSGNYDSYGLADTETLVYPWCLTTRELGNKLGNYFSEVGCAEQSGLNFLTVHKNHEMTKAAFTNVVTDKGNVVNDSSNTFLSLSSKQKRAFLDALPSVIVHPNPVASREKGRANVAKKCPCTRYCWSDARAPWVNSTENIGKYMRDAVRVYMSTIDTSRGTVVSKDTDMTNAKDGELLPIVPDVAIQYRCGDNIGFNYMYGLLPFWAFKARIPADAKTIYVMSDHPTRNLQATYSGRCQTILEALFEYLQQHFPQATVVVKRGGDIFLDVARFSLAKVLICSASTYCVWPAFANEGVAHFPLTMLIAGADNMKLAPDFGPRFKWIEKPLLISDLRRFRPWDTVIEWLKKDGSTGD